MDSSYRIAVLSDLHAAPKSVAAPIGEVKQFTDLVNTSPKEDPIKALQVLVDTHSLKADVIVCPGDMTNRANAQALEFVWSHLHSLTKAFAAKGVVATVGNHDVDSRAHSENSFPREHLMRLEPPFPASNGSLSNQYWAHGFCIQTVGAARFLVINTCWLHESRDELERGVVTDYTLERIAAELAVPSPAQFNFVVCHHHPHPHTDLQLGFDDVIRNGQKLIELLSDNGQWMIIHGHKHHPKVEYAQGQFQQPVVLACGSFSGRIEGNNALVSTNYFHLIEVTHFQGGLAGQILSWNWTPGIGWQRYNSSLPKFPSIVGFGSKATPMALAQSVAAAIGSKPFIKWSDLCSTHMELAYLMPKQLASLLSELKASHAISVVYDEYGAPAQLGRAANE